jgi:hypothetical protein
VHECAAAAYASGHPGQVDLDCLMVEVNRKEPQFRNNRDRLDKLRAWMSAGNAEPVRSAPMHPDMIDDRSVAVEFI